MQAYRHSEQTVGETAGVSDDHHGVDQLFYKAKDYITLWNSASAYKISSLLDRRNPDLINKSVSNSHRSL